MSAQPVGSLQVRWNWGFIGFLVGAIGPFFQGTSLAPVAVGITDLLGIDPWYALWVAAVVAGALVGCVAHVTAKALRPFAAGWLIAACGWVGIVAYALSH
jgi:hypothetical protein